MMRDRTVRTRRHFLQGGLTLVGLGLLSGCGNQTWQPQMPPIPRLGYLTRPVISQRLHDAFWEGLHEFGYVERQTILVEQRADDDPDRLSHLAAELVALKPDVLVAAGATHAYALQATQTIPVVAPTLGDPVEEGLISSLARPGGNLTGLTLLNPVLATKRLELLHDIAPGTRRVGVLHNPDNPNALGEWRHTQSAAPTLGMELRALEVRRVEDFDHAFAAAVHEQMDALLILVDSLFAQQGARIEQFAARQRLPTMHYSAIQVAQGGLLSYGFDHAVPFRRAAAYVDKILRGAKPADLPVEQPTTFDLAINLKTAQALGLTIPTSILQQATEVIQ